MAVVVPLVSLVFWIISRTGSKPSAQPPAATVASTPTARPTEQQRLPLTPEERVAACRQAHSAPVAPLAEEGSYGDCTWPAVEGAGADGYYEIAMTEYEIPGSSGADQFTSVQVFVSTCAAIKLQYKFENQGSSVQEPPQTFINDQIASIYDQTLAQIPDSLRSELGFASDGRLIILSHFRYQLNRVSCVDPP